MVACVVVARSRRFVAVLAVLVGLLGVLLGTVAVAAFVVPYRVDVTEIDVELPGLPASWEGQQIAVISDLQVGMWAANTATVQDIVERIIEVEPAAVLIAGDFLYGDTQSPPAQTREVVSLLQPLVAAGLPVLAVLGNHDHDTGHADELSARLNTVGIEVLRNEARIVGPEQGLPELYIAGLGARRPGLDRPQVALADVPPTAPRLVLMHNPASFPAIGAHQAPIGFAGHTHCGQIRLPFGDGISRLDLRTDERYVIGGFSGPEYGQAGNTLYVTCGIGFSGVPLRLGATPQLVLATLHAGSVTDDPDTASAAGGG